MRDPEAWIRSEVERVEPIVLDVLRGKRKDVEWNRVLSVAGVIPTPAVREVLVERLGELMQRVKESPDGTDGLDKQAKIALGAVLKVLAEAEDGRAREPAEQLLRQGVSDSILWLDCVFALQQVGDERSLEVLRDTPVRVGNRYREEKCRMAEKFIEARLAQRDLFADAPDVLPGLAQTYLKALEERDYEAACAITPPRICEAVTREKFLKLLDDPLMLASIGPLKDALASPEQFRIDRKELGAMLVGTGVYGLSFVYTPDGWKVGMMVPVNALPRDHGDGR